MDKFLSYVDSELMSIFSGQKNSSMEMPEYAIERIVRCLLPMIRAHYESDEGKLDMAEWDSWQEDTV